MRAKEMFNGHQFFSTNKQYVKITLMQNETNLWSIFLVKTKYYYPEASSKFYFVEIC